MRIRGHVRKRHSCIVHILSFRKAYSRPEGTEQTIFRLIAKLPHSPHSHTAQHRHAVRASGQRPSYAGNFLNMMYKIAEPKYQPIRYWRKRSTYYLFFTQIMNKLQHKCHAWCREFPGRSVQCRSSGVSSVVRPLHGGANEAVLHMLDEIGSVEKIPAFIKEVKDGKAA